MSIKCITLSHSHWDCKELLLLLFNPLIIFLDELAENVEKLLFPKAQDNILTCILSTT